MIAKAWLVPYTVLAAVGGPRASLNGGVGEEVPHALDPGVLADELDQVLVEC